MTKRAIGEWKSERLYQATTMAAQQEESLLARCEIPIIDLAHIGEPQHNTYLTRCLNMTGTTLRSLVSESPVLKGSLYIHLAKLCLIIAYLLKYNNQFPIGNIKPYCFKSLFISIYDLIISTTRAIATNRLKVQVKCELYSIILKYSMIIL